MFLQQKVAWLNLGVALASITAFFALLSLIGPWRAMGAFGILGFAGTGGVLYVLARRSCRIRRARPDDLVEGDRDCKECRLGGVHGRSAVIWGEWRDSGARDFDGSVVGLLWIPDHSVLCDVNHVFKTVVQ